MIIFRYHEGRKTGTDDEEYYEEKEVLHYEAMQDLNYPRDMPFHGKVSYGFESI